MNARSATRLALIYVAALVGLLFTLGPVLYMISLSIRPAQEMYVTPFRFIPSEPTLSHYVDILLDRTTLKAGLPAAFVRTMVVSVSATVCAVVLATLAGYSLARFRFRGRGIIGLTILSTEMMPSVLFLVPLFIILRGLNLTNTLQGLALSYLSFALPFCIWMMRGYLDSIPEDLEDAAMVDGATRLQALVHIILPLVTPALIATAAFAFIHAWNEFLFAFILGSEVPLLTAALYTFNGQYGTEYGNLMAAAVMIGLPPVLLFMVAQRYLLQGLTAGAVKV